MKEEDSDSPLLFCQSRKPFNDFSSLLEKCKLVIQQSLRFLMAKRFPFYKQLDMMDCGPTCVRMIAKYYGKHFSLQTLREKSFLDREGVSMMGIVKAAESIGLTPYPVKVPFKADTEEEMGLVDNFPLPVIVHWDQNHFVVVYKIDKKSVYIADPGVGKEKLSHEKFKRHWLGDGKLGVAMYLEASPAFHEQEEEKSNKKGLSYLLAYLRPFRSLLSQLVIGLVFASALQILFPFLTKAIVDTGIANRDIDFIFLVLIAQVVLYIGYLFINFLQSWILLHIGTRINVSLIAGFLRKLMRLPIGFFDSKMIGDLLQRIADHKRIETLLTASTLKFIFSIFNLFILGFVLSLFSWTIFGIFAISSIVYVSWLVIFLKARKRVDTRRFIEASQNQSLLIELIQGMQEIKLQQSEMRKRQAWMNIQSRLFRVSMKALSISQKQDIGANFIAQIKDVFITFYAAHAVIQGHLSLGEMLAIQFIIGQLNAPLQQLSEFLRTAQDAQISLERLGEIHEMKEEDTASATDVNILPEQSDIHIEQLSFRYNELSPYALKNINLTIPHAKLTAIVGTSGSGKTTLIKLLLGFYQAKQGSIKVGGIHLQNISDELWRSKCGAVMQDGFLFSESIARNIAGNEEIVDREKLVKAVRTANLLEYINQLPLGYNTKLGAMGNGLSQGQKQRVLIARAVYKNPDFLFFDEATNALDANNERIIVENMQQFFDNRTVIVVAHRLSTVKNADQIVVLEKGELVEQGTHQELVGKKGAYFHLVKNQLELGS
ncbi:MAG: peptidase domain-containing ABC transporter [Saprospiraceae bacterium]|nr:peptidase domain-containing ABC transporter [Saprospiraceae bacterium]